MKTTTKFIITILLAVMCNLCYAQTNEHDYDNPPKDGEKIIGTVEYSYTTRRDDETKHREQIYIILLERAKQKYPNQDIDIRRLSYKLDFEYDDRSHRHNNWEKTWRGVSSGVVVDLHDPIAKYDKTLSQAIEKSFRNVREGSRMAIDQVTVINGINKEETKDQLIDILLDKGYKVVAKEYLQKLYEEQQTQQSGIYNDKTTVQDNNFSAVGYFINVKVTETSVRVQVVNVSTGEYEGNATVNF